MPRPLKTYAFPAPRDPRVIALARSLKVSRADAFTALCDAWYGIVAEADDDGLAAGWTTDDIDNCLEGDAPPAGAGRAMADAGLVIVADEGIRLPVAQDRRTSGRARDRAVDDDDMLERKRKANRIRQRRRRAHRRIQPQPAAAPEAAPVPAAHRPRRLGTVDGCPVMLLYRMHDGVPFYKLVNALPEEWTGTVSDPENPSFADALQAIYSRMGRGSRGRAFATDEEMLRPSRAAVLKAAERYQAERAAAAADAARRAEANDAFAEAAGDELDDADQEPAERDCHAPVTPDDRDTVTVTLLSRPDPADSEAKSNGAGDLPSVTLSDSVTLAALIEL